MKASIKLCAVVLAALPMCTSYAMENNRSVTKKLGSKGFRIRSRNNIKRKNIKRSNTCTSCTSNCSVRSRQSSQSYGQTQNSQGSNSNVSRTTRISVQQGGRSQGSVNVQAQDNRRRQIARDRALALRIFKAQEENARRDQIDSDQDLALRLQLEESQWLNFAEQSQRVDVSNDNNNNSDDADILGTLLNAPDLVHSNVQYEECPICMDSPADMLAPYCKNQICKTCWGKAIAGQVMCPFCRAGEDVNA